MNKMAIFNKMGLMIHRAGFEVVKKSPEILIAVGVVGVVAGAVMACKATTKAGEITKEKEEAINNIRVVSEDEKYTDTYTEEDKRKDVVIVYASTAAKYAKLYGPAVVVGALSIACILTSHKILLERNAALSSSCAMLAKSFKEYRGEVIKRFGTDLDKELRFGTKAKQLTKTIKDEDGNDKKVKVPVDTIDVNNCKNHDLHSPYAKFFDAASRCWEKNPEYNLMFLRQVEKNANDKLRAHGHLFLNEVYDMLDIPKTREGQIVGWLYDEKNPSGDNYVDFGIYDLYKTANRNFVNGYESVIILDFNVDGDILTNF